jgi:hypothetical protein
MAADDHTPTNPQAVDVLGAQLDELRAHPEDHELFRELYAALRGRGQPLPLAEVCELGAAQEKDPGKAALLWAEAGEARYHLGDPERGERALLAAVHLDPA